MQPTQFINIVSTVPLVAPKVLKTELPITRATTKTVLDNRETIQRILAGEDRRVLVVVGPCSIHDPKAAFEYAQRLKGLADKVAERMLLVMRVYFEKPRTTVGWKGLINDPYLNDSFDIQAGLRLARCCSTWRSGIAGRDGIARTDHTAVHRRLADAGVDRAHARPNRRRIGKWPAACRCRSATRTAPTAACRSRSTR